MEQRTVSVAKAGIVCKLNCRATVVAVTNPRGGLYDDANTLVANTGIGAPLLSRFDLVFRLVDANDQERDDNIATYLLDRAILGSGYDCANKPSSSSSPNGKAGTPSRKSDGNDADISSASTWSMDKLRAYVAAVKARFHPELTSDAATLLDRHYRRCRTTDSATVARTVRLLESLIRLSQAHARLMYREEVTVRDAAAAILLMECSAATLYGYNPRFSPDGDDDPILFRDPMTTPFPPDGYDDVLFLCDMYRLLRRYDMLDRMTNEERRAARAYDRSLEGDYGDGGEGEGEGSDGRGGGVGDEWDDRVDSREVRNDAGGYATPLMSCHRVVGVQDEQGENGVEERDYYGRVLSASSLSTPRRRRREESRQEGCSPGSRRRQGTTPYDEGDSGSRGYVGGEGGERFGSTPPPTSPFAPDAMTRLRRDPPSQCRSPSHRSSGSDHRDGAQAAGLDCDGHTPDEPDEARSDEGGLSGTLSHSRYFGNDSLLEGSASQKKRRRRRAD
mmetsp:Transcript_35871/g.107084  ORF Transcript_35871/g.107084 Transcript_35871/m.107084 type:complete len:504 (-) Transcript_35871:82-1593(-)